MHARQTLAHRRLSVPNPSRTHMSSFGEYEQRLSCNDSSNMTYVNLSAPEYDLDQPPARQTADSLAAVTYNTQIHFLVSQRRR